MSGQMLRGHTPLQWLSYVEDDLGKLPLNFGHNQLNITRDIPDIEFVVLVVVVVGEWAM